MKACRVEGCENSATHRSDGLCHAHHSRLKRTGDVQAHIPLRMTGGRVHQPKVQHRDPYPQIDTNKILRQTFR